MENLSYKVDYVRHLPHIQSPGSTLFVTYRLAGSIPLSLQQEFMEASRRIELLQAEGIDDATAREQRYLEQRVLFGRWDFVLDTAESGPKWLGDSRIAEEVASSWYLLDKQVLDLDTFCIMSNHVHVVFTPLVEDEASQKYYSLSSIMHSHKRHTARRANMILCREGQFWQHESYDHIVRDAGELERIRNYVLNNPVKAGLVVSWDEWLWTYSKFL